MCVPFFLVLQRLDRCFPIFPLNSLTHSHWNQHFCLLASQRLRRQLREFVSGIKSHSRYKRVLRCCICSRLTNSALRLNFTSCSRLFLPFLLNEFSTHLFVFIGNSTPLCHWYCHIVQEKLVWPFIVTSFNVAIWIY